MTNFDDLKSNLSELQDDLKWMSPIITKNRFQSSQGQVLWLLHPGNISYWSHLISSWTLGFPI